MANTKGRRRFGWVRKLPSGRYQASYLGPDGSRINGPETYERRGDADQWLSTVESDMLRGEWTDPRLGRVAFVDYGERWIREHRLSARTREEYASIWRHHVVPFLGHLQLGDITTSTIRSWRATLLADGRSEDRTAKAYRLVRAILNTASTTGGSSATLAASKEPANIARRSDRRRRWRRSTRSPTGCPGAFEHSCSLPRSPGSAGAS